MPMNMRLYTRSQRRLAPAILGAAILAGLQLAHPALAAGQTSDELVAKVLEARGGLAKAKAVKSERITGTIYFTQDLYGPFIAEFKRPGKMHNEVTVQDKTVVRAFNGRSEERRVGKEWRSRWARGHVKKEQERGDA